MKKLFLTLSVFIAIAINANAETSYKGIIDLSNASNGARIPTVINAGIYSVDIDVSAVTSASSGDIILSQSHYRDDNEMICEVLGNFKVGEMNLTIKSLKGNWKKEAKNDIYVNFGSKVDTSFCSIQAYEFEGHRQHRIDIPAVTVELPVNDARFTSIKLRLRPFIDGVIASYNMGAGQGNNSLSVSQPGVPFKSTLENSGDHRLGHELSLTAGGYFHFNTVLTTLKRVK